MLEETSIDGGGGQDMDARDLDGRLPKPSVTQMERGERLAFALTDIVRTYPGGAPTIAILDRLETRGFRAGEVHEALEILRAAGRIVLEMGRWRLRETAPASL
jgi:hypothetical protein